MSLAAFALRTCAVRALRGRTLAGAAVYDSPVDMADRAEKATTPSIFVFSDLERLTGLSTRDVFDGEHTVDLAMMIVLPAEFQATVGGATVTFDDRQAGAAAAIDIIYRQVERALLDESSVWSGLWVVLVAGIVEVEAHAYVLPVGKGAVLRKLPARAIRIVIHPLQEPSFGAAPQDIWAEFVTAMAGDPGLAPLAPIFAAAIEGDALPDWRVEALDNGDTVEDAIAMGYGPLGGGAGDDVVPMAQVTVREAGPNGTEVDVVIAPAESGAGAP